MRLLSRLEKGSRKPTRTLWPISPSSSSSSHFSSQSFSTESPTSPPSSPPSPISYFDPFEPPKSPMSWTWTCHICNHNWRIGTTSRCLNCSHRMCMLSEPENPPSRRKKFNPLTDLSPGQPLLSSLLSADRPDIRRPMLPLKDDASLYRHRYHQHLKRHFRRSRNRQDRRRKAKYCRSQFDYAGWEEWNEWRRDVKQFRNALRRGYDDGDDTDDSESTLAYDEDEAEEEGADDDRAYKLFPGTGRLHVVASTGPAAAAPRKEPLESNCWDDCDFPAHCIHVRNERKQREASLNRVFL